VDAYRRETYVIIRRFVEGRISHEECKSALEAALAELIPRLRNEPVQALVAVIRANNDVVMDEIERRSRTTALSAAAHNSPVRTLSRYRKP
jgi:hypothetical protein